jgi:hypothetical protein
LSAAIRSSSGVGQSRTREELSDSDSSGRSAVVIPAGRGRAEIPTTIKKVSELLKLPDFIRNPGQLFADPKTLPAGPFLAYDHDGKLVSTIYMMPINELDHHKAFNGLPARGGAVDTSACISMRATPALSSRIITSSCGTYPSRTSLASQNNRLLYREVDDRLWSFGLSFSVGALRLATLADLRRWISLIYGVAQRIP